VKNILDTIGNTPIVKVNKTIESIDFDLYLKLEGFNPSGSTKDRSALSIMKNALESGKITKDSVIIESSSGNFGIALAQICCYMQLPFICVVDEHITSMNYKLLQVYNAEIYYISSKDLEEGESLLQKRVSTVKKLLKEIPNSYNPNQYGNLYNPYGHRQTMEEIHKELGNVDYVFCAVSTFGTIRGYAEYIKENNLKTKIIAVDAVGSVIFGGKPKKRLLPGHGAARRSELFVDDLVDDVVYVSDLECIEGCRQLLKKEGILSGASTGGIISAITKYRDNIENNSVCVAIMHDRGERYLNTVYSDEWVAKNFGNNEKELGV